MREAPPPFFTLFWAHFRLQAHGGKSPKGLPYPRDVSFRRGITPLSRISNDAPCAFPGRC